PEIAVFPHPTHRVARLGGAMYPFRAHDAPAVPGAPVEIQLRELHVVAQPKPHPTTHVRLTERRERQVIVLHVERPADELPGEIGKGAMRGARDHAAGEMRVDAAVD